MSDRVYIFDTTLRDGEQSPGATMNLDEKMQIAQLLEEMNVDIIDRTLVRKLINKYKSSLKSKSYK